ncbi:MAG: hypothetical protein H7123_02095 [Thermoleophilia bacterium]|nr:hypothetical protein [Thermoleophilia bacterium]
MTSVSPAPKPMLAPPTMGAPLPLTVVRSLDLVNHPQAGRPAFIAAGSSLQLLGNHAYVMADDELHLGHFPATGSTNAPGTMVRALPGPDLPLDVTARKELKPDIESLTHLPGDGTAAHPSMLVGVPSGSKPNRTVGFTWALDDTGAVVGSPAVLDFAPLYDALKGRTTGKLNIEGAAIQGANLVLFHRGNSRNGIPASITLDLAKVNEQARGEGKLGKSAIKDVIEYDLGSLDGTRLGFTDATPLPGNRIGFTAAAEVTNDPVNDGEIKGSVVGVLGPDGRIEQVRQVGGPGFKVEGIAPLQSAQGTSLLTGDGHVQLRLVTDADDPGTASQMLAATLDLG